MTRVMVMLSLLLIAAVVTTGCQDPDAQRLTPILGKRVTVTVTTSAGADVLVRHNLNLAEGMTALEALQQVADVAVGPQGNVQLVNGRGGGVIKDLGPVPAAWFYRINGLEGDMPAYRYKLQPGDSLWWDLRRYDMYPVVPVAAGGFPHMMFRGYRDVWRPLRIVHGEDLRDEADEMAHLFDQLSPEIRKLQWKRRFDRIDLDSGDLLPHVAVEPARTNLVIGPWEQIQLDAYISQIGFNPRAFGLTIWVEDGVIRRQEPDMEFSEPLVEADGFVWAATTDGEPDSSIVYVISGLTDDGVKNAARAVREGKAAGYLAIALDADGNVIE